MPPWIVQHVKPRFVSLPTRKSSVSLCSVKTSRRSSRPEMCWERTFRNSSNFVSVTVRSVCLCKLDQAFEFLDLGFEFGHVLGHREPLHEVIFELPAFRFGEVVEVFGQFAVFLLELAELVQVLQPFTPSFERQSDRCHTGGQPTLQYGQRQTDVAVLGRFGPLEVVLHVCRDGVVERQFLGRELVGQGLDVTRREAGRAIELLHVLLETADHDAVFVVRAGFGQDVAVDVQVLVEQLQQQGEVVGIAFVRRGGEEQVMVGVVPQEFAELIPLRFVDLRAVAIGRHLVRFVHDAQVQVHVPQADSGCRPGGQRNRPT